MLSIEELDYERVPKKHITMRLHPAILNALEKLIEKERIIMPNGKKYSVRLLIEDILIWVLSNEERTKQFLNDMFEVI